MMVSSFWIPIGRPRLNAISCSILYSCGDQRRHRTLVGSGARTVSHTRAPTTRACSSWSCSAFLSTPIPVLTRYGRHLYSPISMAIRTACPPALNPLVSAHDARMTTDQQQALSTVKGTYSEPEPFPPGLSARKGYSSKSFLRAFCISSVARFLIDPHLRFWIRLAPVL